MAMISKGRDLRAHQTSCKPMREEQADMPRTGSDKETTGPTIVYVIGAGHCGSTLLSLALDRHTDVLSVSEINGLNAQKSGYAGEQDYREHGFWSRVAAIYEQDFSGDFWSIPFASPRKISGFSDDDWRMQNYNAFSSIAKTAGASLIVDASKQPRRLEVLLQEQILDVRVIYLVRDARAIVHSYDRKYKSIWRGLRQVRRLDRRAKSIKQRVQRVPWITVRYEDMTEDLESTIRQICEFCNISFQEDMQRPDTDSFVGIGGNRLRQKSVKKICADMTWMQDMPSWKQMLVGRLMGGYQLRLGYSVLTRTSRKGCIK